MSNRVLLLNMPFASIDTPSIALSLLKPLVEREGIVCDVRYLNLQAYTRDPHSYAAILDSPLAEWVFSEQLFGNKVDITRELESIKFIKDADFSDIETVVANAINMEQFAGSFLDESLATINWNDYSIIGFTSQYWQQVASLALARRIKERWPDKVIAFGGANCDGVMGRALLRLFAFVDWVFSGEADISFPRAVVGWFHGKPPEGIQGVSYRRDGQIVDQGSGLLPDLDSLPYPDYSDYFQALKELNPEILPQVAILVEFSRGCWWGRKSHCIFCGLNRNALHFRRKSTERAEAEAKALVSRYNVTRLNVVDNILDIAFLKSLMPALSQHSQKAEIFLETKANLNREHVQILKSANVCDIQPGIESLDSEMLSYMHKGITELQNVQLLKWAREYGINALWNLLYGFPGENPEAYSRMASIIPSLAHLRPPVNIRRINLQRFSPLFDHAQEWGLRNVKALKTYHLVYPFKQEDLDELAYFFEYDCDGKDSVADYTAPVKREAKAWQELWENRAPPLLAYERESEGRIVIYDSRPCRLNPRVVLEGEVAVAYIACDARRLFDSLANEMRGKIGGDYTGDINLRQCLDDLVERRLMLREGDWYLSLANDLEVMKKHSNSMLVNLLTSKF